MTTTTAQTTQVYQVFIKATPEQIWEAITKPEFTARYFHGARIAGHRASATSRAAHDGDDRGATDRCSEFDPPRRLVHEWRSLYDPELAAEEPAASPGRSSRRTAAPACSPSSTTGWRARRRRRRASPAPAGCIVLSGLKTLLETGQPLA